MCKVCLTASKNKYKKYAIRCRRICTAKSLNSIEYLASEVLSCVAWLNCWTFFLNLQYNFLAIHLADFSANFRTRKLRLMSSLYKQPTLWVEKIWVKETIGSRCFILPCVQNKMRSPNNETWLVENWDLSCQYKLCECCSKKCPYGRNKHGRVSIQNNFSNFSLSLSHFTK